VTGVWLRSDARGTTSITATEPATPAPAALTVPETLAEAWRVTSGATTTPMVGIGAVMTADGGAVTGHDPRTGSVLWSYQRNMPLCGSVGAWQNAVAVYRDQRGCSQVTELAGDTGNRVAARSSYNDDTLTLSFDGTYVLALGPNRLEVWRSDLVRTLEYGYVDAPVNPRSQPRSGCALNSAASSSSQVAVLERCPGDEGDRLTVLHPAPKDPTKPEEKGSAVLTGIDGARVLATAGERVLLYLPEAAAQTPRLAVYDSTATAVIEYGLNNPLPADATVADAGASTLLWTGNSVISLRESDLSPEWTAPDAIGPGAAMGGRILMPVPGAIAVLDVTTGRELRRIPVDRGVVSEPISTAVLGGTVFEQRGTEVVALS
jgi:hypothetical protein